MVLFAERSRRWLESIRLPLAILVTRGVLLYWLDFVLAGCRHNQIRAWVYILKVDQRSQTNGIVTRLKLIQLAVCLALYLSLSCITREDIIVCNPYSHHIEPLRMSEM